jgi:tRNA (cytidine/uridine-2'-O-)-methyltransferase
LHDGLFFGMRVTPTANVVLVAPEIAGNTGNVIRLCANTGSELHLIEPLGFVLDDARMKRAGLDYHERTSVRVHSSFATFLKVVALPFVAFTARGTTRYDQLDPALAATMVFGCEASGLPDDVLSHPLCVATVTLPMMPNNRSLNLANTVAITVFDRWRQLGFPAGVRPERGLAVEGLELVPPDF